MLETNILRGAMVNNRFFIILLFSFFFVSCESDKYLMIKQKAHEYETISMANNLIMIYSIYNHKMPESFEDLALFIDERMCFDEDSLFKREHQLLLKNLSLGKAFFVSTNDSCFYYNQSFNFGFFEGGLPKTIINWPGHYWYYNLRTIQKRCGLKFGIDADTSIMKELHNILENKKYYCAIVEHPVEKSSKWYSPIVDKKDTIVYRYFVHIKPKGKYCLDLPKHRSSVDLLFDDAGIWKKKHFTINMLDSIMNIQSSHLSTSFAAYMKAHSEIEEIIVPNGIILE